MFPGLLQTPEYARALHDSGMPRLSPATIEQRIEVRMARQQILTREKPPAVQAIMDEAVLHRPVGGPAVMSAQLDRVIKACELPNVSAQVLPFAVGAHPALDSTFTLLKFLDPFPGVVYVEGLVGQLYLERSHDVERYERVFERLSAISLNEQRSVELMASMSAAYREG